MVRRPIRLLACGCGAPGATAAQNLANKMGVEVYAATDTVWAYSNGALRVGPDLKNLLPAGQGWKSFWPGNK